MKVLVTPEARKMLKSMARRPNSPGEYLEALIRELYEKTVPSLRRLFEGEEPVLRVMG